MRHLPLTLIIALAAMSLPASASSMVSGGTLLSQTHADQLATWLGEGDLLLTNVYSAAATPNSYPAWHTAVDPYARTFSVISTNLGLIGGYNPVNWNASLGGYVVNPTDTGRTAFIYNLSTGLMLRQRFGAAIGAYQTHNAPTLGPSFGAGYDLAINGFFAQAYGSSYGNGTTNIFNNSAFSFTPITLETFSITTANPVPEPATFGLAGAAILALLFASRKSRVYPADGTISLYTKALRGSSPSV